MFRIFVPTRGRVNRQITRKEFMLDRFPAVNYVVPESEEKYWKDQGVDYLVVPEEYKFSDVRQFILGEKGKYHLVLDDDLRPAVRVFKNNGKFSLASLSAMSEVHRMGHLRLIFKAVSSLLMEGWVHGGLSVRQGNNRHPEPYDFACREMRFHFYNAEVVRGLGYDFRRTVTKQDLDFTLFMLTRGIPNVVYFQYCQEQAGNNVHGGCSLYRTEEVLVEGANKLKELHPEFVEVVTKTPKFAWGATTRTDVKVYWKKAFHDGQRYRSRLATHQGLSASELLILNTPDLSTRYTSTKV